MSDASRWPQHKRQCVNEATRKVSTESVKWVDRREALPGKAHSKVIGFLLNDTDIRFNEESFPFRFENGLDQQ